MNLKYTAIIVLIIGLILIIFPDTQFLGFIAIASSGLLLTLNGIKGKDSTDEPRHPIPHITEREILINEFLEEYALDKKYKFELKGITFTNAYQMIKYHELIEFDQLTMEIEPNNAYDPNAVALFFKKEKVGYVDQDKAKGAKALVEQGFNICYISNIKEVYNEQTQKKMYFVDITLPYKMKS
ncbi:HIRAN domain-containing protein [Myroides sp.]|uniref:HIRAN domain-containing protein n=1 Tax=Myroides sp. TaxID=1874736 RepID=UPI0028AFA011|nr:HIRAN domain-containing protein [Myroides sp.]